MYLLKLNMNNKFSAFTKFQWRSVERQMGIYYLPRIPTYLESHESYSVARLVYCRTCNLVPRVKV